MKIQVGDKLPSVDLYEDTPANKVNLAKLSAGKKLVIFAVPGAFTPGCSKVCTFNLKISSNKNKMSENFLNFQNLNFIANKKSVNITFFNYKKAICSEKI